MKNGMKVIDCENHFMTKLLCTEWKNSMTDEEWEISGGGVWTEPEKYGTEETVKLVMDIDSIRLNYMDKCGIDFAQVSLTSPGAEYFNQDIGTKIASDYNDILIDAIKKHPDRIGAYMALYPNDIDWSLKEIDRCAKGGMFGWSVLSNINGKYIDEPEYFPLLEKMASYNMPIYIHPTNCHWKEYSEFGYCLNGPSIGFTADTQLSYMRLIHRGIFDKLPNLKIIMGHDCEGMGFYKNRIDTAWRQGLGQPAANIGVTLKHEPSYYLDKNTWGTTSGNYSSAALRLTIDEMGKEKIMLGTDFNYEDVKAMVDFVGDSKILTNEEKEYILYKNAESFGIGKIHTQK